MVINLRKLNESLDRLCESNILDEAFNDSFPKWLKDRLSDVNKTIATRDTANNVVNQGLGGTYRGPKLNTPRPGYSEPRGWYGSLDDLSLFRNALNAGMDFQNAQIVEGPVPIKRTDPRLSDPNIIPIWGLKNGQVYMPGLNDREIYNEDQYQRIFERVPAKVLMSDSIHFATVDKSAFDPQAYADKRASRKGMRDELVQLANENPSVDIYRAGRDPSQFYNNPSGSYRSINADRARSYGLIDQSGYVINPSRYEDALKEIGAKKIFETIKAIYNRIIEVKDDITAASAYIDPMEDRDAYRKLSHIIQSLSSAIDSYNGYCTRLDDATAKHDSGAWTDETYTSVLMDISHDLKNDRKIKDLDSIGADVFLAGVDWLE